ncbi:hypothetical protein SDC9_199254 [bioreactor metagenome]|uniref:Uncharacterized protein n=1 Tax=bioreactor metagenome TaxID=1076179 RepID=A0A645IKQ5_9ZZZZ
MLIIIAASFDFIVAMPCFISSIMFSLAEVTVCLAILTEESAIAAKIVPTTSISIAY